MTPGLLLALAGVITVTPTGPVRTLGEAVRRAQPGDTILVRAGRYAEPTILVDRRVVILGEGQPVFDGEGARTVLRITADSVVVRGLVVRNTGALGSEDRAGILVDGAHGVRVEGNEVRDAAFGIYGKEVRDLRVVGNMVAGPGAAYALAGNGIQCWSCEDVAVEANTVTAHRDGIYLEFASRSAILRNTVVENLRYGLHFMRSDTSVYRGNSFDRNGAGIAVMYSGWIDISGNRFTDNRGNSAYALLLKEISDSRVHDNDFTGNTVALYLENSNRNIVEGNRFRENGRAIRVLANAVGNTFSGNSFIRNSFDVTTNSRSATSRFEGNYWDQYRGYDLDRDGVGDVAFRPVRLFSLLVEQNDPALILLRSPFVDLLDVAERVFPVLTPAALADARPLMGPPPGGGR